MMIKFFIYLILFSIFLNFVQTQNNTGRCKISLLLSGDFNDLGYNFMMNDARVRAERNLKSEFSLFYKNLEISQELAEWAIQDSIKQGANFIIISSTVHTALGYKYAEIYKNEDIYWLIRGNSRPSPDLEKVAMFNFESYILHYTLGYFSALMSKTGIIGFITPGPNLASSSNDNSFYLGAKAANSSIKFLNIYTGSWLNPEVSYKASEFLISNGADYIGMCQDDMSIQQALIDHGSLGIGETGFPNSILFGSDVGLSYVTNWTDVFTLYASRVKTNSWVPFDNYSTSYAEGGSLSMDKYSYKVPQSVQDKVNSVITQLKNNSYEPFRCDPLYLELKSQGAILQGDCIEKSYFDSSLLLLNNQYIKEFGLYTIPIKFVDYSSSLKLGITSVSGISILFCLISMILVLIFRHAKIIRSASPTFCLLILLGCIIIFCACIVFAQTPNDRRCNSRVWLLSIGFTIFLGNLLVKNWRIWLLFDNPKLKKRAITNWKLYPFVLLILLVDILILSLWSGLGNIVSEKRTGIDGLTNYEYHEVCTNNNSGNILLYILLVYHGIKLLLACFISFKIKTVDIDEFNESKPISTSVYLITFCLFIVIPLMISPQSISSQTAIICICSIFVTLLSIIILFGSKFYKMATKGLSLNETFATSTKSSSFSLSLEKEENDDVKKEQEEIKKSVASNSEHPSRLAYFTSDESDDIESVDQQSEIDDNKNSNLNNNNDDDDGNKEITINNEINEKDI